VGFLDAPTLMATAGLACLARCFGCASATAAAEAGEMSASKLTFSPPCTEPRCATVVARVRAAGGNDDPSSSAGNAAAAAADCPRGVGGVATEAEEGRPTGMREELADAADPFGGDAGEWPIICARELRWRTAVPGAAGLSTRACILVAAARRDAAGVGGMFALEPRSRGLSDTALAAGAGAAVAAVAAGVA
jgi:hypothetical protein